MKIKVKKEEGFGEDNKNAQNKEEEEDNEDVIAVLEDGGEHFLYYDEDDIDDDDDDDDDEDYLQKIKDINSDDNNNEDNDDEESGNENDMTQFVSRCNEGSKQFKKQENRSKTKSGTIKSKGRKTSGSFRSSPSSEFSVDDVQIVESNTVKSPKSRRRRKKR